MEYVDEHGQPAYGVVWSPGPMPGTVWVLPESGASKSSALVVKVASGRQVPHAAVQQYLERYLPDYLNRFRYAPRLPNKAWHDAIGYDPRAVVREDELALDFDVETPAETPAEPVSEPVAPAVTTDAPTPPETPVEPVIVPVVAKASDPRNKPAGDTYKGVHTERYMGHTVRIQRGKEWGTLATSINGHALGNPYGTTNADAVRALAAARAYIDDAVARPANYHNGYGEYTWAKPGQTTMPREAQRAAPASSESLAVPVPESAPAATEPVPEPVPAAAPIDAPTASEAPAETPPEPVPEPVPEPAGHCSPCPPLDIIDTWSEIVTVCRGDHPGWRWSAILTITQSDHAIHLSKPGHDRQGPRPRVRVPSRSCPRAPAPPRHAPMPCLHPRVPAGPYARPCLTSQIPARRRPRAPTGHSVRAQEIPHGWKRRPVPVGRSPGPAATGLGRCPRPRSGRPGAGPNGVRDEPSLRSPTPGGWLRRAASYRKLVARVGSPDGRVATGSW
jgi:hypothetical protein